MVRYEIIYEDVLVFSGDDKVELIKNFREKYGNVQGEIRDLEQTGVIRLPTNRRLYEI